MSLGKNFTATYNNASETKKNTVETQNFEVKLFMGGVSNSDRQPFCVTKSGGGKHWLAQRLRQYFHLT
jgi:hypothetical protein